MKNQNDLSDWNAEPTAQNNPPTAINSFMKRPGQGKNPGSRPFFMAVGSFLKQFGSGKSDGSRPL